MAGLNVSPRGGLYMAGDHETAVPVSDDFKIARVEEVATVSTRKVVTGRVRVSTTVEEVEEAVRAALDGEVVEVTRVTVDKPVEHVPQVRTEGDITIVPIVEEILVVEKRLVLKGELHIRRSVVTRTVEESVTLRRDRAIIEHLDENGRPIAAPQDS